MLQQGTNTMLQDRCLATETPNTGTPQVFPDSNLVPEGGSEMESVGISTSQAESYELPPHNDFGWQDAPIPEDDFSMLLFPQNDFAMDETTYLGAEFEAQGPN